MACSLNLANCRASPPVHRPLTPGMPTASQTPPPFPNPIAGPRFQTPPAADEHVHIPHPPTPTHGSPCRHQ